MHGITDGAEGAVVAKTDNAYAYTQDYTPDTKGYPSSTHQAHEVPKADTRVHPSATAVDSTAFAAGQIEPGSSAGGEQAHTARTGCGDICTAKSSPMRTRARFLGNQVVGPVVGRFVGGQRRRKGRVSYNLSSGKRARWGRQRRGRWGLLGRWVGECVDRGKMENEFDRMGGRGRGRHAGDSVVEDIVGSRE